VLGRQAAPAPEARAQQQTRCDWCGYQQCLQVLWLREPVPQEYRMPSADTAMETVIPADTDTILAQLKRADSMCVWIMLVPKSLWPSAPSAPKPRVYTALLSASTTV